MLEGGEGVGRKIDKSWGLVFRVWSLLVPSGVGQGKAAAHLASYSYSKIQPEAPF